MSLSTTSKEDELRQRLTYLRREDHLITTTSVTSTVSKLPGPVVGDSLMGIITVRGVDIVEHLD